MIIPVFLPHLGCGMRCSYCNQDIITNTEEKDGIEEHIASLLAGLDEPAEVGLYSGNMLGLHAGRLERLFSSFTPYRDRISAFRISAKPGPVRGDQIDVLKKHGVRTIELGIPTFNDRILADLNRGHTREDLFGTYELLRREGFEIGLQVMVGLPGETRQDLRETTASVARLAPAFIRIYPLLVIDGTPLAEAYRKGDFSPDSLEEAVSKVLFICLSVRQRGIKTIKMGLSENEVLKKKILAGPYHPAFGYLVKCEAFYLAVVNKWETLHAEGDVQVWLNRIDVPHLTGHRRSNLKRLREKGIALTWQEDDIARGAFILRVGDRKATGDMADALAMIPF